MTTIPDHSAGSFGAAEQLVELGDGVQAGGLVHVPEDDLRIAALILGFALSAVAQAVVRRTTIVRLLGYDRRHAKVIEASIQWNCTTTVLNIIFLILAAALCYRFVRPGGIPMLKMMGGTPDAADDHHAGAGHGP